MNASIQAGRDLKIHSFAGSKLSLFVTPSQLIGMHSQIYLMIFFQGRAKKCRWSVSEQSIAELTFVFLPSQSFQYPCYLAVRISLYANLNLLFMHIYDYKLSVTWWHHKASHRRLWLGVNSNLKVSIHSPDPLGEVNVYSIYKALSM